MGEFTMPSLGADMESGTVSKWLVRPGDTVHRGDIVAVVETEKSDIEVEIFQSGVIDELLVPEGERVRVGTPLARVSIADVAPATAGTATAPAAAKPTPAPVPAGVRPPERAASAEATRRRVRATRAGGAGSSAIPVARDADRASPRSVLSPVLRRLADQLGVDLAAVRGSGPEGVITRQDIERLARAETVRQPWAPSSPFARRRARELGVDIGTVRGTGPGGAALGRDVLAVATSRPAVGDVGTAVRPPSTEGPTVEDRQAALRRSIGALMARSKREIPHYYLSTAIDARAAAAWLDETNRERPVEERLLLPVLLLKATALAVAAVPEMNGFYLDDAFVRSDAVHVGVAVSLRTGGVIAPAIHDVGRLELDELTRQLKDLVGRTRTGTLRSSEMSDPTITVTNLGDLGVETVFGVIYPPQVALVGFGRVTERPYAEEGMLGVRPVVTATLSADHRVSDGHRGGRFLAQIDRLLQEPDAL